MIETHPLVDGEPFPTLYWLTCVRAGKEVGRLEAGGAMRELNGRLDSDADFRQAFDTANADYVSRRDAHRVLPHSGAVGGGPTDRVKCLHAHLAHHLVCACNPVGEWVVQEIGDVFRPPPCIG